MESTRWIQQLGAQRLLTFNRTVQVEVKLQYNEDRIGEEMIKKWYNEEEKNKSFKKFE